MEMVLSVFLWMLTVMVTEMPVHTAASTTVIHPSTAPNQTSLSSVSCNFDAGLCGWYNDRQTFSDNFDWRRNKGLTSTPYTGPTRDHTTGQGYYMYIETDKPRINGDIARLISANISASNASCLYFWYHMNGNMLGRLRVYSQRLGARPQRLLELTGEKGNQWNPGQVQIPPQTGDFQIIFEGVRGISSFGDIGLDDVTLDTTSTCKSPFCDFEVDLCGYKMVLNGTATSLTRQSNGSLTVDTGPRIDHTISSRRGHYMYMYTSRPPNAFLPVEKVRINSPIFLPTSSRMCLEFCYSILGNISLHVYGWVHSPVWTRVSGRTDTEWHCSTINIGKQKYTWKVVFEGLLMTTRGGLAFDDIGLTSGECLPQGDCTFEYDTCGYYNIHTGDKLDWVRSSGATNDTGLNVDHTLGTSAGSFMHVKGRDRAWLYSKVIAPTDQSCLSFWYFMHGNDAGILRVYQARQSGTKLIWNTTGSQGAMWRNSQIKIISNTTFQIVFTGKLGSGNASDIAIDDIFITAGPCNNSVMTSSTPFTATVSPTVTEKQGASATIPTYADLRQGTHLQCFHHGWYATVDISKLSPRPTNVTNIYMGTDSCTGILQGDLLVFSQTYQQCNTHAQVVNGKMTFSNYLLYVVPNSFHTIRHIHWEYNIQCSHPLSAYGTLHIIPKVNVTKQGSLSGEIMGSPIEVSMFKDSNFKDPLQGTASVGSSVFVQVTSLSHPDVVMVLDACNASVEGTHPSQNKSFPLIEQHCSVESSTQFLVIRNQLTRFKFDMFDLPNDHDGIYVTCSVHFCDQMDLSPRCDQRCQLIPNPVIG